MIKIINKGDCCGCQACANICPKTCISMKEDKEGFLYPTINERYCINCDKCISVCPIINSGKVCFSSLKETYAAYNNNTSVRIDSSSGGIFSLLAVSVLKDGGVVFGAGFDESLEVRHFCVTNEEELAKLRGSKYVQSNVGNSYIEVKKMLKEGRKVLFSGTPCQVEALLFYLGTHYDNLITQDIVCHGVPSPMIWRLYKKKNRIKSFSFRDKTNGWTNYSYRLNKKIIRHSKDAFSRFFVYGYSLRPSCYDCKFKKANRHSDITLGDLWGSNEISSLQNNDTGISLVVTNTLNGKKLFDKISCTKELISFEKAIEFNKSFVESSKQPTDRQIFFDDINIKNFGRCVKKYTDYSFAKRIKKKFRFLR